MASPSYVTQEGYDKLLEELKYLKTERRREVAERLHNAIDDGADVLENAEYEAAMNEQAFVEGRISDLEDMLSRVKVVEVSKKRSGRVELGSLVKIQEEDFDPEEFQIVGMAESDAENGKISMDSPLGKALLNHVAGDQVTVDAPVGKFKVAILEVDYR